MFGHTFSGYGNQNLGGVFQAQPSREIPANALSNVQQPDYPLSFDQYSGEPLRMLAEIVWQVGIMDKSDFFLTDILPVQETNKLTADLNMTIFEPKLMDTNPEWSQAKLVSFSKRQRRKRLIRRGLQMELEQGFADTEYGRDTFNRYVMTIIKSQRDTLSTEILLALEQAPLDTEDLMLKKDPRWRGMTTADYMSDEVFFYGIMQKNARPFEALDARIRKNMAFVDGQYDTLIVPSHVTGYTKSVKDKYLDYNMAGPSGQALSRANPDNNDDKGLYPGISGNLIVPLRPTFEQYRMNHGAALMTSPFCVGEYYCCKSYIDFSSKYWTPDNQAIEIYDETDSTRKKITLLDICLNSKLFAADGSLAPLKMLPYAEHGDLKLNPEQGIHDMWSDAQGDPLLYFGEIDWLHLSPLDIVHWSKAVVLRMKKEAGITAEQFANLEAQLVDYKGERPSDFQAPVAGFLTLLLEQLKACFPRSLFVQDQFAEDWFSANPVPVAVTGGSAMTVPSFIRGASSPSEKAGTALARSKVIGIYKKLFPDYFVRSPSPEQFAQAARIYAARAVTQNDSIIVASIKETADDLQKRAKAILNQIQDQSVKDEINELVQRYIAIYDENKTVDLAGGATYQPSGGPWTKDEVLVLWNTDWKDKPDLQPDRVPADPVMTWLPITWARMDEYFGKKTANWDKDVTKGQTYLQAHLHALYHLIQQNDGTHDAVLSQLHEKASPSFRDTLRKMSVGSKEANEALYQPNRYISPAEAATLTESTMHTLGSRRFILTLQELITLCSGLTRVIALAFISSEIHQATIQRWASCGIPLPFQGVIFRPNITHRVSHAIACMRGRANLGHTLIGKAKFTYGSDPGPQSIMGHFTFYSLPVIEKPWNVCVIPAITVDQYLGGKGTQWINIEKEMTGQSEQEQSMLGLIIPLRAEMPMVTSITGSTFDLERVQTLQLKEEPYFPQALRFRFTAGTQKMLAEDAEMQASRPGYNPRNFICWPGKYWFREESEFKGVHEGKGHFGNTDGPDAKFIRGGALAQYVTDAGGANRY